MRLRWCWLLVLSWLWQAGNAANPEGPAVDVVVFVSQSRAETEQRFAPLVSYLRRATGLALRLVVPENALDHWHQHTRRGAAGLVIEAAQFTDYRTKHRGYVPLVSSLESQSYSLVTAADTVLLDPEELHGKLIAALPPPDPGTLMLLGLFPDAILRPAILEVATARAGVEQLVGGHVVATLIPTEIEARFPHLNVFITTESGPGLGVSAARVLPAAAKQRIRDALIAARGDQRAALALRAAGISGFQPASATTFDGAARWLRGTWGFAAAPGSNP